MVPLTRLTQWPGPDWHWLTELPEINSLVSSICESVLHVCRLPRLNKNQVINTRSGHKESERVGGESKNSLTSSYSGHGHSRGGNHARHAHVTDGCRLTQWLTDTLTRQSFQVINPVYMYCSSFQGFTLIFSTCWTNICYFLLFFIFKSAFVARPLKSLKAVSRSGSVCFILIAVFNPLLHWLNWAKCKMQGDGRKFLDRFKSYFGSKISSQSLNEIHIYQFYSQNPQQKGIFFIIFVFDCQFESPGAYCPLTFDLVSQGERFPSADFDKTIVLFNVLWLQFFSVHFPWFQFNCRSRRV